MTDKKSIEQLDIKPEEYAPDVYDKINWDVIDSEMTDGQRRFISGLIQYYEPENVLELGVSAGGGTVVLLNSLLSLNNWNGTLVSIDVMDKFYRNPKEHVGFLASKLYKDIAEDRWKLLSGVDPAEKMEEISLKFDFVVIDTYHHHPVEVLNFISILPWLNEGAIVVMHDTTVFEWRTKDTFMRMLSPRLLLSSVCADKYIPKLPSGDMIASNIASWQVTADTMKYSHGLFDVLYMPWEEDVKQKTLDNLRKIVKNFYPKEFLNMYDEAILVNRRMIANREYKKTGLLDDFAGMDSSTVFYGAGKRMDEFLGLVEHLKMEFDFEIWDQNANKIQNIRGVKVELPDGLKANPKGRKMIVMIENPEIYDEVRANYEKLGFDVIWGISGRGRI